MTPGKEILTPIMCSIMIAFMFFSGVAIFNFFNYGAFVLTQGRIAIFLFFDGFLVFTIFGVLVPETKDKSQSREGAETRVYEESLASHGVSWSDEFARLVNFMTRHILSIGAVLTILSVSYLVSTYWWLNIWSELRKEISGTMAQQLEHELIARIYRLYEYPLLGLSLGSLILGILLLVYWVTKKRR